jgi:glycosyltransferase involved in cell wall biosynthesis
LAGYSLDNWAPFCSTDAFQKQPAWISSMKRTNSSRIPKLCITSPWNYPLFDSTSTSHFGGWEVRIALIAKELARRKSFQVSMVIGDHGQPHIESREAVTLYSWIGREIWGIPSPKTTSSTTNSSSTPIEKFLDKIPFLAKMLDRIPHQAAPLHGCIGSYSITSQMISIYDEVDADIYMVPGNSQFSGEVAFYCRQRGKKYVFLSGSDYDYYPEYKVHPDRSDMYSVPYALKTYAIKQAALHIVQNERQARLLEEGYGRPSWLIKNPIDLTPMFPRNPASRKILWVGKSDERTKRPFLALELARRMPQHQFTLIVTFAVKEVHDRCLEDASRLPNVTLIERVPFSDIERHFADACVHINTSVVEGFPNTFLQAAKYGVPTVSLQVDPGGILSREGCGCVCDGNLEDMALKIESLMDSPQLCADVGHRSRKYLQRVHDKDLIVPQYEEALRSILDGRHSTLNRSEIEPPRVPSRVMD